MLNFNAVAQGYSCDTVASYLSALGVKDMLVDIGEIWCCGVNQAGKPWRIGVDRPKDGNNTPGADTLRGCSYNNIPGADAFPVSHGRADRHSGAASRA